MIHFRLPADAWKACSCFLASTIMLAGPWLLAAETATNSPAATYRGSKRFLIVLETSSAMKRRSEGTMRAVREMMFSSMAGQLRSGDSIGVWTYGQKLITGKFPLQQWSFASSNAVISAVLGFVQQQDYSRQANLEVLRPALEGLLGKSDLITVILISDGTQKFSGAPFASNVNPVYEQFAAEQQRLNQPFVTVFRGHKGKMTHARAAPAQARLELPPLPVPPPVASAPTTPPVKKAPIGKPLILVGPKRPPEQPVAQISPPAAPSNSATNVPAKPAPSTEALVQELEQPRPAETVPAAEPTAPPPTHEPLQPADPPNPEPSPLSGAVIQPQAEPPARVAQTATAVAPQRTMSFALLGIVGLFLIIAAALIVVFVNQRSRRHARAGSLITESYERKLRNK